MLNYDQLWALFQSMPYPAAVYEVKSGDFSIVEVNSAFLELLNAEEDHVKGANAQDLALLFGLADNDGMENPLLGSLEKVCASNIRDEWILSVEKALSGSFDAGTTWKVVHTPIKDAEGRLSGIVQTLSRGEQTRGSSPSGDDPTKEILKNAIREKEILLSEIHHRVKNNLMVISEMMEMQAKDEDHRLAEKLMDSVSRINAISNIHEHIYKSDSFSYIDFAENLKRLIDNLLDAFKPKADIRFHHECEPVFLNIAQATTCSLIVNEVVTNAIKHAFVNNAKGSIFARLSKSGRQVQLEIADDGVGLPEDFESNNKGSLGLQIVKILSRQLKGNCAFHSQEKGTRFTLHFEAMENETGNPERHNF